MNDRSLDQGSLAPWPCLSPEIIEVFRKIHGLDFLMLQDGECSMPLFIKGSSALCLPHDASIGGPHGPAESIGRFFSTVTDDLRTRGIRTLLIRNQKNPSWFMEPQLSFVTNYFLSPVPLAGGYGEDSPSYHHRRRLKKFREAGYEIYEGIRNEDIPKFVELATSVSKSFGTLPPSTHYLEVLLRGNPPAFVWSARKGKDFLGALIGFANHHAAVYKYGFCTQEGREAGAYYGLVHAFLKKASELGAPHAHLGISGIYEEGLIRFKQGWGAEQQLGAWHYILGKPLFRVWKLFPAPAPLKKIVTLTPDKILQKLTVGLY